MPDAAAPTDPAPLPLVPEASAAPSTAAAVGTEPVDTVSVRALCEFTARHGDLDRRFTPSATALEGIQGQQGIATRRGPDYETEIALVRVVGTVRLRGRADGWDPRRRTLEEIKTIRGSPDELPENRRRLHWAQLETYGALFCAERGLEEVALALVYLDIATDTETELREVCGAEALEATLQRRVQAYLGWAEQERAHRQARDTALAGLPFPQGDFRPGQRDLAEAVYRAALHGRCLLAQAPTGIGKTVGTLFPLLRAMPVRGIDRVAFLTCKGTGRLTALEALRSLREATPGRHLRVLTMVAKEQACEHPGKACHPDACALARGFYDRLPAARAEAVMAAWMDPPTLRRVALAHGICPYYLGQELVRWADVMVGDVHHLFDARGQVWALTQGRDWRLAVLVDEAHNLVERIRQMYSGELKVADVLAAASSAPAALRAPIRRLAQVLQKLAGEDPQPYRVFDEPPHELVQALLAASSALSDHFRRQPAAVGSLLDFHFALGRIARLVEALGEHALLDLQCAEDHASPPTGTSEVSGSEAMGPTGSDDGAGGAAAIHARDAVLTVRNVVPAPHVRQRWAQLHSTTLFSATLTPPDHLRQLLGLPEHTGWIDLPPAFDASHLVVQVAQGLSTRFAHRSRSLQRLLAVLTGQFDRHPGNYLAFFSSFEYLDQVADALARARPDIPQWRQDRRMSVAAREGFLGRFHVQGQGIGFAVLGGVFAEGVDLPGSLLIGAFVATLGLPPVSPIQQAMAERLERCLGDGRGHADLVAAMHRVVQAAGRVLRTPHDRGWLWLLDDRYRREDVVALLPAWWQVRHPDG